MRPGPWCTTSGSAPLAGLRESRDPPRAAALLTGQAGLRESLSEVIWGLLARDSEGPSPSVALGAIPNAAASRASFRVVTQNRTKSGKGHSVPVTGPWCSVSGQPGRISDNRVTPTVATSRIYPAPGPPGLTVSDSESPHKVSCSSRLPLRLMRATYHQYE
jgi:hypothetical protein